MTLNVAHRGNPAAAPESTMSAHPSWASNAARETAGWRTGSWR